MRTIINIVLFLIVCLLTFLLVSSIRGPIQFNTELEKREDAVIAKLEQHRNCQLAYKNLTGEFAKTYDTLQQVLMTDSFEIVKIIGDADAVGGGEIKKSYSYVAAKDSLANFFGVEIGDLQGIFSDLDKVPFGNGKTFAMRADTLTYQKIIVPVINVATTYEDFMEGYTGDKFRRYNSAFDPDKSIGYGDLSKPTTSGTWD